ncbi:MAG: flagellar type III secretion system pore protein FliP [Sphingomonadaceae bacterium]
MDDPQKPFLTATGRPVRTKPLLHRSMTTTVGRWLLRRGAKTHWLMLLGGLLALLAAGPVFAADAPRTALGGLLELAGGDTGQPLSLSLQVLLLMSLLTLLPSVLLMMTAFVRIIIVLAILRQAIGLQQAPPNQLLVGLALFMTFFVMQPALDRINQHALQPFVADTLPAEQAIGRAGNELHGFMLANTRTADLGMFSELAGEGPYASNADVPMRVLMPAYATSELKTAFQIGVLLFLPFLVIDLVVASVLMALGMMMVSPVMIALPFKLLLFVAVDGWALIMASLAQSFAG